MATDLSGVLQLTIARRPARIRSIDWLRGLAVVFMIECHALYLLSPIHDHEPLRNFLNTINGLPAASFILCAGLSIGLVCSRIEPSFSARLTRYNRSVFRIEIVLISSMFLKQLHWKLFDNPDRILWPNVLDCIALSLLVTVTITLFAPFRRTILALIFASLFIIAPLVQKPHTFGVLTPLINNSVYSDTWPLVPWGGYACLGAVIGLSLNTKDGRSRFPQLFLALGITGLLTSICWPLLDLIYLPKYTAFYITNAGERSAYIGFIALMLWGLEQASHKHLWIVQNPFAWLIELYSRQSLVAYIGHLVIFYGIGWFRPYNRFHQQCGWWSYALLAISLMAVTAIVCYLFDLLSKAMQKNPIRQGISPPKPAMILNHD